MQYFLNYRPQALERASPKRKAYIETYKLIQQWGKRKKIPQTHPIPASRSLETQHAASSPIIRVVVMTVVSVMYQSRFGCGFSPARPTRAVELFFIYGVC